MPELPEVEHLRRTLSCVLPGRRVVGADLRRADVCRHAGPRPPGALLEAGVFVGPHRHGKQLALVVEDGRVLRVQLGMSGQMFVRRAGATGGRNDHVHAHWTMDDGSELVFRDPRRFGGLTPFPDVQALRDRAWAELGPDALSITPGTLGAALARTTRPVKAALLDQRVLAGVGNIYADEALFEARVPPDRPAHRLGPGQVDRVVAAIRRVLRRAIRRGGSTLRDYIDGLGRPGRAQRVHAVYGRAGLPCVRCGSVLRSVIIGQRTTVYCPMCQC